MSCGEKFTKCHETRLLMNRGALLVAFVRERRPVPSNQEFYMSSSPAIPETQSGGVPAKETKTQRAERLKREKNPWEAFEEIRAFARDGRGSVMPEWAEFYFKWWGIYTQGDGAGVTGGSGGVGKVTEYFMMRIAIPNGIATAKQIEVIADIAAKHGRDLVDITVRQAIQLHWLTIETLPEIIERLDAAGLSPK